jgi:hypothetical protein
MPITHRIALLTGICLLSVPCWAQNGVFGNLGQPTPQQPAAAGPNAVPKVDDNPLRIQLLEHSRRGDLQLADAISSLARIGRWSDVDRLLLQMTSVDAAVLVEVARRIGPALFLRMKQQPQLGDPARSTLGRLEEAAKSYAESRQRLRDAIGQIDSPSIDTRLSAARVLLGGGNVAISELVAAAASENPPAPRDEILRVMLQFGSGGPDALRQLALYAPPAVRNRALESLARINRNAYIADLLTGMYAADSGKAEEATARAILGRMGSGLPSLASALEILFLDFHDRQDQARRVENDGQLTTLWSVSADQTGVTFQPTSVVIAAYRDAADAGSRLRRVGGLTPENVQAVLAADLAYRVMIDPDWGDPDQIKAVRAAHGSATAGWSLSAAIGLALEVGDHTATIGLIRMLDSETSDADRDMLLTGSGASPTPLVGAASSPHPRVRYEAALAVARLAEGGRRYPGSSRVMHCLSEMRSLGEQPTAILVETRSEVVLHMERLLGNIGLEVEVVGSVSQLQRRVARGGDLRMILSKTELADLPPVEMIDLVRRIDRGHDLPIVFYGSEPVAGIQGARWQTPTMLIDLPVSAAAFDGMLDAVARKRRVPPLSVIDRQSYRKEAVTLLDRLAQVR